MIESLGRSVSYHARECIVHLRHSAERRQIAEIYVRYVDQIFCRDCNQGFIDFASSLKEVFGTAIEALLNIS